jgi:hypothetical protein
MSSRRPIAISAILVTLLLLSALPLALLPNAMAEDDYKGPWSRPVRMDGGKHTEPDITSVRLVQATDGTLHVAWMDERDGGTDTFTSVSVDGGNSWSEDLRVDPFQNQLRNTPTTCDIQVTSEGRLFATYTQWMLQQGWWRVRFARSDDGGESFRSPSDAFFIVDDTLAQEHPKAAVSSAGSLTVLYLERTPTTSKLFIVRSEDGLNALPPRIVEPGMPDNESHVQGDIAIDGDNNIYVTFGYRAPGEAGVKLAKFKPGGSSVVVSKVWTVTEDAPRSLRPTIAVQGDVVEVAFDPLTGDGRLIHVRSSDGGATWNEPGKIWGGGDAGEVQADLDLAFDALGHLHAMWAQGEPGKTRVRHSISLDGVSFTAPTYPTAGWNETEMGPRLWEGTPAVVPTSDGGVVAAFSASLNNTIGVYFVKMANDPPVVEITSPDDGELVKGTVYVQGTAADMGGTTGLDAVYVQVGEGAPTRLPGTTEWEHSFDSGAFPDGDLVIKAWASDGFVEGEVDSVTVDVDNNRPPVMNLVKPINGTTYVGTVPVVGTAEDDEGFGEDTTVQWRLPDAKEWTDSMGWELQTENILDFDFELDLSSLPTGPAAILVRVSDGDKHTEPQERTFEMENKPDLVIDSSWITVDIEEPEHNDIVTISVTIKNEGAGASGKYDVEFRRFKNFEGQKTGRNLSVGESDTLNFVWEAVKGENTLIFTVDPQFKIPELDKDNNEARIEVKVKEPPAEETDETDYTFLIAVLVVVAVAAIGGVIVFMKFWAAKPGLESPEVQVVYDKGGMYSEGGGEYAGADTSGRDLMESPGEGPTPSAAGVPEAPAEPDQLPEGDPSGQWGGGHTSGSESSRQMRSHDVPEPDQPPLDSKDNEQLTQDVEIRTEKEERA